MTDRPTERPTNIWSLLCPASKILERLVLPLVTPSLAPAPTQHGYRPMHSAVTALLPLSNQVASGFNAKRGAPLRTATVSVDISKAFDAVDHTLLLQQICATDLHPNLVHWLATYLRGRQSRTIWQGQSSQWKNVKTGVPQGSVLGPVIFNFFVSDCPVGQPSYADDFCISCSAVKIEDLEVGLQREMDAFCAWASTKNLKIAPSKSKITLFTPDKRGESQVVPRVLIDDQPLQLDKAPRYLGVTFDTHFHFHVHADTVAAACKRKLNTLRALAGTSWGCSKETLLRTYKTYISPSLNFAAAVWSTNASPSSIEKLQRVQNSALRIATGCHVAASDAALHTEAKVMPVDAHLAMLSSQFLLSSLRTAHPSNPVVTAPPGPRKMKATLQSAHLPTVAPYLVDGATDPVTYGLNVKKLHTDLVSRSIDNLGENPILEAKPPDISPSELSLSRVDRCTLAQLRSGQCKLLNDYSHTKLQRSPSAICPECLMRRHNASHLFDCEARPTELTFMDLWTNPVACVAFLKTLPSFSSLLPPEPPPPRPPPEPPP